MTPFNTPDEVLDLRTTKFELSTKRRISAKIASVPSAEDEPVLHAMSEGLGRHYSGAIFEAQKAFPFGIPSWPENPQERHTRLVNAFLAPYGTFGSLFFPPRLADEICLDLSKPTIKARSVTPEDLESQRRDIESSRSSNYRFASTGKIRRRKKLYGDELPRGQKGLRKLVFDDETTPPVSGTIIIGPEEDAGRNQQSADIDPALNLVEVTDEARAELARIENKIGEYICRLCKLRYNDAFTLAQHRCSRIIHLSYICSECDKVFNCPANLASHRRWHQPRGAADKGATPGERKQKGSKSDTDCQNNNAPSGLPNGLVGDYRPQPHTCWRCFKSFSLLVDLHRHNCSIGDIPGAKHKFLPVQRRMEI